MQKIGRNDPCPCGSGEKWKRCCGPALEGQAWPATPEALMRSRYTAYAVGHAEHLLRTIHPEHPEVRDVDRDEFLRRTRAYCRQMTFTGLTIHDTEPEDAEGVARVRFTAAYQTGSQAASFTERSEFVRLNGNWVYRRGEHD